jgi:hypothetical protein
MCARRRCRRCAARDCWVRFREASAAPPVSLHLRLREASAVSRGRAAAAAVPLTGPNPLRLRARARRRRRHRDHRRVARRLPEPNLSPSSARVRVRAHRAPCGAARERPGSPGVLPRGRPALRGAARGDRHPAGRAAIRCPTAFGSCARPSLPTNPARPGPARRSCQGHWCSCGRQQLLQGTCQAPQEGDHTGRSALATRASVPRKAPPRWWRHTAGAAQAGQYSTWNRPCSESFL